MKITLNAIKEFWKLPEGQRFLSGCFLVIGALCSVITFQNMQTIPQLHADKQHLEERIGKGKEDCGRQLLILQQRCDSEKSAMRDGEVMELKERIRVKEQELDEAIRNNSQVNATQQKTLSRVRRTIKQAIHNTP